MTDNADQFSGVVTMLHDRTREDEISKMKTDFVSHVSHELPDAVVEHQGVCPELLVDGEASDDKTLERVLSHYPGGGGSGLSRLIEQHSEYFADRVGDDAGDAEAGVAEDEVLKQVLEVAMPSAGEGDHAWWTA